MHQGDARQESDLPLDILRELHRCAKSSAIPGTAYWVVDHNGPGSLRSFRDFIDANGKHDASIVSSEASERCSSVAYEWLLALRDEKKPPWRMLLCAAHSEGDINMIPIYPDDPRVDELDFGPSAGVIKQAPSILGI